MFSSAPDLYLFIALAIFTAAFVHSAVGVGFGLIATPFLLLTVGSGSAVTIVIFSSVYMGLLLVPLTYRDVDLPATKRLILPIIAGAVPGIIAFRFMSLELLKIFAAIVVSLVLLDLVRGMLNSGVKTGRKHKANSGTHDKPVEGLKFHAWLMGVLTGFLSVTCAIPGPSLIAHTAKSGLGKKAIRGTVTNLITGCSFLGLALTFAYIGFDAAALKYAMWLIPSITFGVLIGNLMAGRIPETAFRWIVISLVAAMTLVLLVSAFNF